MSRHDGRDATLESVVANLAPQYAETAVSLTILFHPAPERIGEAWEHALDGRALTLELGRYQPEFGAVSPVGEAASLGEGHISRRAVLLSVRDGVVTLEKIPGACLCRVNGLPLAGNLVLDDDQLLRGVTLQLGHAVVLWLRTGPARRSGEAATGSALLGRSARMQQLRREIARAAATELDILVLGETGVGKELTASDLHRASARAAAPLVSINMSAIPASLAPSLLFGSARGAFTGATREARGYFQQADGGTLFLDEIGDTPGEIQPQLLRALQQREIQIVGGQVQSVDLRVIAATDAQLNGEGCNFSVALRHRLGGVEIQVPPLREHLEDTGELLLHFLREAASDMGCENLLPGAARDQVSIAQWAEVFQLFACNDWPGNVRELANTARQLLVASEGQLVLPEAVLQRLRVAGYGTGGAAATSEPAGRSMDEVAVEEFREAFIGGDYEVAATARALGVSRQAVYRRLEEHPDLRLATQVPEEDVRTALAAAGGDVREAARILAVSEQGLRSRLRASGSPR